MPTVIQSQLADRIGVSGPIALLQGATSVVMGAWYPLGAIRPWSITVRWDGNGSFTARIHVSNNKSPTNGDTHEPQLDVDINDSTALTFDSGWQFVAFEIVSISGATVSAFLLVG